MNIIITGATSFLASSLINKLSENNHIFAIVRKSSSKLENIPKAGNITLIQLDLSEMDRLSNEIESCDVFFHFAWDGSSAECRNDERIQRLNVEYSLNAVYAAHKIGCKRFIFAGSQAEYGYHNGLTHEYSECKPVSEYGKAKLDFGMRAKKLCDTLGMEFIHTRIFSVYGAKDRKTSLIMSCINVFENGGILNLSECNQLWNYLYIDDFVDAITYFADYNLKINEKTQIINIAGEDTRILRNYIEEIYDLSSKKGNYSYGNKPLNPEGASPLNPDITLLRNITGFKQNISFCEGIKRIKSELKIQKIVL